MRHALMAKGTIVEDAPHRSVETTRSSVAHEDVLKASKEASREFWPLRRAIVSISNRDNLELLERVFEKFNVDVIATTGTYKSLLELADGAHRSFPLTEITKYTGKEYNLNGRLKTLDRTVQAGVLAIRNFHDEVMDREKAKYIDLVVVNLYPFREVVRSGADFFESVENIDIGGPTLIRAGAKNHVCVTVIVDPSDYELLGEELERNSGKVSPEFRRKMACKAFKVTSEYDTHIANWFEKQLA